MPDKDLDQRMPFGVDEKSIQTLHGILLRVTKEIEDRVRREYEDEHDFSNEGTKNRLETEIEDFREIEYLVSCSDKTSNHRLTIDELLNFPNYDHAQIQELAVSVGTYRTPRIRMELRVDPDFPCNVKVCGSW